MHQSIVYRELKYIICPSKQTSHLGHWQEKTQWGAKKENLEVLITERFDPSPSAEVD